MTNPTPTPAPPPLADEPWLRATLARSGTPEAAALTLLGAIMKAEDTPKPTRRYLLDTYAECLNTVYAADGRCGDGVQSPDADRDTRDNLGKAISEIGSIIEVLQATDCANEEALGYLIDRLEKSRNQALDAFWRIFKMHPYDQGGAA